MAAGYIFLLDAFELTLLTWRSGIDSRLQLLRDLDGSLQSKFFSAEMYA
jgi:hypothetical protein